ncbi:di-heme oxidoredictase family protein [Teredinibacter purpureus]|uniref:di-heme oxidoredictase family protein n=1 Tax=Teredinibacter purpureus TaxID=2731756 RepID=UPI000697836A|nr:di-heme oxidoredictase family protein [Teredinibacter purpureus]
MLGLLQRLVWGAVLCSVNVIAYASPQWVKPIDGLSVAEQQRFWTGFSLFRSPWVAAPASTTGRDGLGPLFNARSCDACHHNGAQGDLPEHGFGAVIRLGHVDKMGGNNSSVYGEQLQPLSIDSVTGGKQIPPEVLWGVQWQPISLPLAGQIYSLKKPVLNYTYWSHGAISKSLPQSLRLAPSLFGLGELEALSEAAIVANEDIADGDGDGLSGKANRVLDRATGKLAVGRFGHKAEQPNLRQQIAAAFFQDVGISSWLYPAQNCSVVQTQCRARVNGNSEDENTEISREKLALVEDFSRWLKASSGGENKKMAGYQLFVGSGCDGCHRNFEAAAIRSDLLLHDMGEGLSDGRTVGQATAREWRTMPLRGLGRKLQHTPVQLLHDGRAGTLEEAILWHGGEAAKARQRYLQLTPPNKKAFIQFLTTL